MTIPEMRRPLPEFQRWLDEHGDGTRAPGFQPLADLAERTQKQSFEHLTDTEAAMLRMWQGMTIACVELCTMEVKRGTSVALVSQLMARVCGCAAFYSAASALRDDTPWRQIARLLTEEFRWSTKVCADQLTERAEAKQENSK